MKTMFVANLPNSMTEDEIRQLFSQYGTVRAIKLATDVFTGRCRGFGTIAMEGHEARAAIAGLNGKTLGDKSLRVRYEDPRARNKRRRR
jgi:RNA recognition motif-containing protein